MRKSLLAALLAALLLLSACTTQKSAETPSPTPTTSASAETPTVLAEAEVRAIFEGDGYYRVLKITPYEGDYLVEIGQQGGGDWRALQWVFGETGKTVRLTWGIPSAREIGGYRILSRGKVEITTSGKVGDTPLPFEPPRVYEVTVAVDSQGRVLDDYEAQRVLTVDVTPHYGWLPLNGTSYANGSPEPRDGSTWGRYEQLYDARLGVDDLSFSFIPSGDPERFGSFFAACTSVPGTECTFDTEKRIFTIRFINTSLKSGGMTDEMINAQMGVPDTAYLGLYPYSFPAGSLGADGHFVKEATIARDREDTVVTMTLTDKAYAYQVDTGNLGTDTVPFLRVTFRERWYGDE